MISLIYSKHFLSSAKKLPKDIQAKLAKQLKLFQKNPFYPSLQTKSLAGQLAGFYSFRISREWRVIFQFEKPETVKLIEIGHRKDIYR